MPAAPSFCEAGPPAVYATLLDRWVGINSEPVLGGAFRPVKFV